MALLVRKLKLSAHERARRVKQVETFQAIERRLGRELGWLLRTGVFTAAALVIVGAVLYLSKHGSSVTDYSTFNGQPARYTSMHGIFGAVRDLEGQGIILLGILVLIMTPVARVLFSAFIFARQRDWAYLALTAGVLSILVFGLAGGKL